LSALLALWYTALAILAVALLIMAGLLLGRLLFGWRETARRAERQRLIPLLLRGDRAEIRPEMWLADAFIADLTVELIQLVRGTDRERFIDRATELGVPERLRHQLGSASPRIRQAAAEALGLFDDETSVERLTQALDDRNADVRLTAALGLAQAGRAPPIRELVRRLAIGGSEKSLLVNSLFKEIARYDPDAVEEAVSSESAPPMARIAAAEALAEAGRYSAVPAIARAAMEAPPEGSELPQYLRALGTLGHPAAREAVAAALDSPSASARAAAAEAAGRIGLADLGARLQALLSDPSWRVRFRAGEALARLGEPGLERLRTAAPGNEAAALSLAERGLE
jgi:HEAT repeat protein